VVTLGRRIVRRCRAFLDRDGEADALAGVGFGLIELGKSDEAVPVLNRCVWLRPDSAECLYHLGRSHQALNQLEAAADSYQKAINVGGYDELTAVYVKLARDELARLPIRLREEERRESDGPRTGPALRFGTGFFATEKGHILTNRHVVEGCRSIKTRDQHELQILSLSEDADLALLKSDIEPPSAATFRSSPALKLGETVVAFGYPLPGLLSAAGNMSSGTISALTGLRDDKAFLQISAPLQPGNSGGPLLDDSGNVIGVVVGKLDAVKMAAITGDIPQNVNFAVHLTAVKAFLSDFQVFYKSRVSAAGAKVVDVAAVARSFSLAISCHCCPN
jgi:S1-C subfamily serine protease